MLYRFIAALCFLSLLPVSVAAAEDEAVIIAAPQEQASVEPQALPACNDTNLVAGLHQALKDYYAANTDTSLIEQRYRRLMLQNLAHFEEVPIKNLTPKDNYLLADHIIMAKINLGVTEAEMRLCRNLAQGKETPLYLLIYPVKKGLMVEALNLGGLAKKGDSAAFLIPSRQ